MREADRQVGRQAVKSEPLNQALVQLIPLIVHNSTVCVQLIVPIYVEHQAELLNARPQVNGLCLTPTKLKSDEVALTEDKLIVHIVERLFSREGSRVNSQIEQLLS